MFARFLHCQVSLFANCMPSLEEVTVGIPQDWTLCPFFYGDYLSTNFGNLYGRFVSSPSFINVFSHLSISLSTQGVYFYELYSTILLYLVAQIIVPTLTTEPLGA